MPNRKELIEALTSGPHSPSSLSRLMGIERRDIEEELLHAIRSARAAGHGVSIVPARCKACGFLFGEDRLTKPSRCPACKGSRIFEPLISLTTA